MKIICAECSKLLFEHSNDDCSAVFKAKELGYIFKNPILFTGKSESLYFCNEAHKNQYFAKNIPKDENVSKMIEDMKADIPNASQQIAEKMDSLLKLFKSKK